MTELATRVSPDAIAAAVDRLRAAQRTGKPCAPIRDLIGTGDVVAAYAVQQRIAADRLARGETVVGRKIGLTSAAVQQQMGVDQPDFGILFDVMAYQDGAIVPFEAVLQPRVEGEVAFLLGKDLVEGPLDDAQVRDAIDYGVAAIEICGSRIAGWNISFADTVADNASSGAYVLGTKRLTLAEFQPDAVAMTMTVTDAEDSTGTGAASLGDPVTAVVWLARQARELGQPLRAGQVILSGALGPMRAVTPGADVHVTITGLGTVSAHFSD